MLDERTIPDAQLPTWMRQARRGVDWGVIIVMVLSIFIAWPFIANEHLPQHTHLEHSGFQISDASSALLQGWFFPRWSAIALEGYGTPLPHYVPSAAPNLTAVLNVLFLNDVERAIRIVMIGAFLLAGGTLYVFVTQRAGARAGVLAGALYLFSPYVGLVTPYVRGDLAGVLSLAALPTFLWAANRLLLRNQPLDSLTIALSTGFLLLNDPLWLLLALLPLLTLLLHDSAFSRKWRQVIVLGVSMLLGVTLAALFWLPALLEAQAVRWVQPLVQARETPITLLGLFARTESLDPQALVYYSQANLGWGLLLVLGLGLLALILQAKATAFQRWFLLLGIAVLGLAIRAFPAEDRLLGLAIMNLSIGASAAVQLVRYLRRWQELVVAPLSLLLLIGIAYPVWVQVPQANRAQEFSQAAQLRYERRGYGVAMLPPGEAIPTTLTDETLANLQALPTDDEGAVNRAAAAQSSQLQIVPLPPESVPAVLEEAENRPTQGIHFSAYSVVAAPEGGFVYQQSYFPGWQALLNDSPVPLQRDETTGLMEIFLPQTSNQTLFLELSSTPPRRMGWLLTGVGFIVLGGYTTLRWRTVAGSHEDSILLRKWLARVLLVTAIFALVLRIFPNLNPLRGALTPAPEYGLEAYRQFPNVYDGEIDLTRYCYETALWQRLNLSPMGAADDMSCQPQPSYDAGDRVSLELIWEQRQASDEAFMVQMRLVSGATGEIWIEAERRPFAQYALA